MPKEKPIIFSTEMVRAILEEKKTQTRRPLRKQPPEGAIVWDVQDGVIAIVPIIVKATLRHVVEAGEKPCPHNFYCKRACPECWAELRREVGLDA